MRLKHILSFSIPFFFYNLSFSQCKVNGIYISDFLVDPSGMSDSFDTDLDGTVRYADEFIRIYNDSNITISLNGFMLSDITGVRYAFSSNDSIPSGEYLVVISKWQSSSAMPAHFRNRNLPSCWNNAGDDIILSNGTDTCTITYPTSTVPEQDGCVTTNVFDSAYVDCSITPSDIGQPILPVTFLSVELIQKNGENILQWSTLQEHNVSHYEIEKSLDQVHIETIGLVSAYNRNAINNYRFDNLNIKQNAYYRLKQVDFDNRFTFSKFIKASPTLPKIVVKQNLQSITVEDAENIEIYDLFLSDINGKQLLNVSFKGAYIINKSTLKTGVYLLMVSHGGHNQIQKLVIN